MKSICNTNKPIFICDFDSTIVDSILAFCKVKDQKIINKYLNEAFIMRNSLKDICLNDVSLNDIHKEIVELEEKALGFIPTLYEKVNNYDFRDVYPDITKEEVQDIFASYEFFNELELFPNAYEVLKKLNEKYQLIICSIGSHMNLSLKSIYINKHLPFIKDVILIRNENCQMNKSIVNMDNVIAMLDDHEGNLFNSNLLFDWRYCFGEKKSWNEKWDGNRLRDWLEVAKQFNINIAEVKENNNKMEENKMENTNKELIGYCKECFTEVYSNTQIEEYEVWECPECFHPNSKDDLFPKIQL